MLVPALMSQRSKIVADVVLLGPPVRAEMADPRQRRQDAGGLGVINAELALEERHAVDAFVLLCRGLQLRELPDRGRVRVLLHPEILRMLEQEVRPHVSF